MPNHWKALTIVLALTLGAEARAGWSDLKAGQDAKTAVQTVGTPLVVSKSKTGAHATWTYDDGGYIQLERGRVTFWQAPKVAPKVKKG